MARGCSSARPAGVTEHLPLVGAPAGRRSISEPPGRAPLRQRGRDALQALPGADRWLWRDAESGQGGLSEAMVRFAVRHEMARSVEDVLARRSGCCSSMRPRRPPGRRRGRRCWPRNSAPASTPPPRTSPCSRRARRGLDTLTGLPASDSASACFTWLVAPCDVGRVGVGLLSIAPA
jgi:hypothetical protein